MKRRSAIKNLTMALGGLVSLPAWASGWAPESVAHATALHAADEAFLAEIVETIVPETTTPGAKSLKVHQFILRMVNDCYGEPAQAGLQQGLVKTDEVAKQLYNQSFVASDAKQRTEVLLHMSTSADAATKQFADMMKNMTIRGYMNSEYVMTNILGYVMAPGFYHGCVPVTTLGARK